MAGYATALEAGISVWLSIDMRKFLTTLAENRQLRSSYMFVVSGLPPEVVRIIILMNIMHSPSHWTVEWIWFYVQM